jgi:NTP pyrophosphatase (non-canonical NTP hydrolase)
VYEWTPETSPRAEQSALWIVGHMLRQGADVAVAECLPTRAHVAPYMSAAGHCGAIVRIVDLVISADESKARNVHNVRPEDIDAMAGAWVDGQSLRPPDNWLPTVEYERIAGGVRPPAPAETMPLAVATVCATWSAFVRGDTDAEAMTDAVVDLYSAHRSEGGQASSPTWAALQSVVGERRPQDEAFGEQRYPWPFWLSILGEEFGELAEAINETVFAAAKHPQRGGLDNIREEAVQVAAVAVAMIEHIDAEADAEGGTP